MSPLEKDRFEQTLSLPRQAVWGVFKVHETGATHTTPYVWCDSQEFAEKASARFNHTVVQKVPHRVPPAENKNCHSQEFQQMRLFSQD